jgi:hypothetical protein
MEKNSESIYNLTPEELFLWQCAYHWRQPGRLADARGLDWQKVVETGKWNRMQTLLLDILTETDQLESPDGLALFELDAENGRWIPVIPEGIAADLPEDTQPVLNDSGIWEVLDSTGNPIYAWDWIVLAWLPAEQEVSVPPLPEAPSQDACPLAMVPRLAVGATARAVSFQNFRSSPDVSDNLVYVLAPTSEVPVIGGPLCVEFNGGAHLWWEVTIDDGTTGWMAEGSADGLFYFLEPVW